MEDAQRSRFKKGRTDMLCFVFEGALKLSDLQPRFSLLFISEFSSSFSREKVAAAASSFLIKKN